MDHILFSKMQQPTGTLIMHINWFPGHMKKAGDVIREALGRTDLVIEVLDARLPGYSSNPLLTELRGNKPCIKILNKQDLADPTVTRRWVTVLEQGKGLRARPLSASNSKEVQNLLRLGRELAPGRGSRARPLRILIVGIPNVGKSTLINTLAGRKIARVGDKPAITTCKQQIDLRNGVLLFDTPGILWPDLSNQQGALMLAASGAIGDNAVDNPDIAQRTLPWLQQQYPNCLEQRYQISGQHPADELLALIGKKRGCLVAGGEVDLEKAAKAFLLDLRSGRLGRISLQCPEQGADNAQ